MLRGLCLLVLWFLPRVVFAQAEPPPVALFADNIRYESASRELVATGNVEVYYQDYVLTAAQIRYGGTPARIRAEGPISLHGPDGTVLLASLADLGADFQDGLIQGARLILDQQFQIAAVEAQRSQGRYNTLYRTVASSCSICERSQTPIWRIRARQVVHDEQAERLYFQNAFFDIFGVPVLYVPTLRVPAPGVRRASGMLIPSASTSGIYGIGVKAPAYFTLGDHADVTLTPFLTTTGTMILEGEYRQRFASGQIELSGALALDDGLGAGAGRGFISATGAFVLPRNYNLDFALNQATDRSFLGQFGFTEDDRLESFIALSRNGPTSFFETRAEAYQTLRENEKQRQIPYIGPQISYRKLWRDPRFGTLGLEAGFLSLIREQGRDVLRGNAGVDWTANTTFRNGMQLTGIAAVDADIYAVRDDPAYSEEPVVRTTPTVGVELRWPLARTGTGATHIIEPVAQLLYSDTLGNEMVPNEDSLLPELDENNLFALTRFPGRDAQETGLRLNTGISYKRLDSSGWDFGLVLGRVFKPDEDTTFSAGTGLREASSDYVAAVSLDLPLGLSMRGRSLFDDDFDFKRADLELDYATTPFDATVSYIFLAADGSDPDLGFLEERQEVALAARYRFAPNWQADAEWRYDIANSDSIYASGGLTFGNECIEARLGVSRRFTSSVDVAEDTRVSFEVNLAGLGGNSSQGWPARHCQGN